MVSVLADVRDKQSTWRAAKVQAQTHARAQVRVLLRVTGEHMVRVLLRGVGEHMVSVLLW